jgi:hypothetical protein
MDFFREPPMPSGDSEEGEEEGGTAKVMLLVLLLILPVWRGELLAISGRFCSISTDKCGTDESAMMLLFSFFSKTKTITLILNHK